MCTAESASQGEEMNVVDGTGPWAGAPGLHGPAPPPLPIGPPPLPGSRACRFVGDVRAYWRLMIRGAFLLLVTLGIYRFWLATDQRRFLWANTEIAGDALEYTGTARELLIGFLIAIAVLIPLYLLFFLATLDLGLVTQFSGVVAFVLLALFGQFAIYRARRYRLTRTVFRGVRLHQTGSAWIYAFYSMLWWVIVLATFGLAYPWAQAGLERYKMRHTFYGTARGRFAGSGTSLFIKGIAMWLVALGPLLAGLFYAITSVNWTALLEAIEQGGENVIGRIESSSPNFGAALAFLVSAASWTLIVACLLYPAFQAMMLRWWASGLHFDSMAAASRLRTRQMYGLYLRFMGYSMVFGMIVGVAAGFVFVIFQSLFQLIGEGLAEIGGVVAAVISYVVVMLGYSTIYQVVVKMRLWQLSFETTELSGLEALDTIKAAGVPSSAFGEGLADALDVGGL
jgi:uncharacterized membrane protein YjgN (DUF898 family)